MITSNKGNKFLRYISPIYEQSIIMQAVMEAIGTEWDDVERLADEVLTQLFPHTATWGIAYWEQLLGIPSNNSIPIEQRRARVLARMQTRWPMTRARMEQIVNQFVELKNARIEERYADYSFDIIIPVGGKIAPGLRETVEEVKPAHLFVIYERLVEADAIVIIDDDYSFPLFYRQTGKFWGQKYFSQMDPGNVAAIDESYSFKIKYPISRKSFFQIESHPLGLINDTYDFKRVYRETGKMTTLTKQVNSLENQTSIAGDIYDYKISYRLCGQFSVEGE